MGRGTSLSMEEIAKMTVLKDEGYSNRNIARKMNRSAKVVNNFFRNPENYGKNYHGQQKMATTPADRRMILRTASNSSLTSRQIRDSVGSSASVRTVQRIIKASPHLKRCRLLKKPILTERHRRNRLEFAKNYMAWTTEWNKVVFSDEKRFCLDGPDGMAYYFHDLRKEKLFLGRRHSREGGVMVWGAICINGVVTLKFIDGRQTANDYIGLLQNSKIEIQRKMDGQNWIFQHDHAAIHTARSVKAYLTEENIEVLPWPSLSPDLNIIENLWGWLARTIYGSGQQFSSTEALKAKIESSWNAIPVNIIESLYNSIPNRIFEVINKNGGNTHY